MAVLLVKRTTEEGESVTLPSAETVFLPSDRLVLMGTERAIHAISED